MTAELDSRLERDTSNCSIARTLDVVGEKWTLLILREIFYGSNRFSDFEHVLGCPRNLLAARLKMLVDEGILAKQAYREPGSRSRSEYVITPMGLDLVPAVIGLLQWGDRYRADPEGPAIAAHHQGCGANVEAELRCARGHRLDATDITITPGAAFRLRNVD